MVEAPSMRQLVCEPNPILRRRCEPVADINSYICDLARELVNFIKSLNQDGLQSYGIAAPQLGEPVQLFVVATSAVELVCINPRITKMHGIHRWIEGCLSLPGKFYSVSRPKLIKFQYTGLDGETHSARFHDDYAGIFHHEIQHLDGILIDQIGIPISYRSIFLDDNAETPARR